MTMAEKISAVVPVRNGARFIQEALDSIDRQQPAVDEIIVVDDGSRDNSASLARVWAEQRRANVRIVQAGGEGPAAARNRGITAARGEVLAFLDVDDLWPDDKLRVQVAHLRRDPQLHLVMGLVHFHSLPDAPSGAWQLQSLRDGATHFRIGCGLYRRRVFELVGGFDETMRYGEDMDWLLRIREHPQIHGIRSDEVGLVYRLHAENLTHEREQAWTGLLRAIKNSMDRRRQGDTVAPLADFPSADPPSEP